MCDAGVKGRWFVTPHAVKRFRERVPGAQSMSYERALAAIISDSERAHFVRVERDGTELWRVGKPHRTRYRIYPSEREGVLPQCVTVLAGCERGRRDRRC